MHRLHETFGFNGPTIKEIKEGQNEHRQLAQELVLNRLFTGPKFFNLAIYGRMWQ